LSPDGETLERGLGDFAVHYTMQSERDVHESITRVTTRAASPGAAALENVEFF
jgi:hypothetical protein